MLKNYLNELKERRKIKKISITNFDPSDEDIIKNPEIVEKLVDELIKSWKQSKFFISSKEEEYLSIFLEKKGANELIKLFESIGENHYFARAGMAEFIRSKHLPEGVPLLLKWIKEAALKEAEYAVKLRKHGHSSSHEEKKSEVYHGIQGLTYPSQSSFSSKKEDNVNLEELEEKRKMEYEIYTSCRAALKWLFVKKEETMGKISKGLLRIYLENRNIEGELVKEIGELPFLFIGVKKLYVLSSVLR